MANARIINMHELKVVQSPAYNMIFNRSTGHTMRWGRTEEHDPRMSPFGPEILDLEISVDGCPGFGGEMCQFCYKENTRAEPTNMSLDTFRDIMKKMPPILTQIAFGITGTQTNPDFLEMMRVCKHEFGVIPNYTLTGVDLTSEIAQVTSEICGAVAVSINPKNKGRCYDTVYEFTSRGMRQVNIHLVLHDHSVSFAHDVLEDMRTDYRLSKMQALVFLGLKKKGRARHSKIDSVSFYSFSKIVEHSMRLGVNIGFDSCSAPKFIKYVECAPMEEAKRQRLMQIAEPCEAFCFSSYINVHGDAYPCSFCEDESGWKEGVSVTGAEDFLRDVWYSRKMIDWRKKLWANNRHCPVFSV